MPLYVSSTCTHHQEVKIALHSRWYHTYRCDDTSGCVMQFWPPDDDHMCSKHIEAWNKLIVKQKFCASSWLITEINILNCRSVALAQQYRSQNHQTLELHYNSLPHLYHFIIILLLMFLLFVSKIIFFFSLTKSYVKTQHKILCLH